MVSLLLCSSKDPASINLHNELLLNGGWADPIPMKHGILFEHKIQKVHMLLMEHTHHIFADNIDIIHEEETNVILKEVLVLSKHVSKSKIPALTVHAIGLPGQTPLGEKGISGGINGEVIPPSPRFFKLFQILMNVATEMDLDSEFDITLESTHHGPFLSRPTLYLEIGSTMAEWIRKDVAKTWAIVISKCLGLDGSEPDGEWKGKGDVMLCLGGGHYAPRHKSIISQTELWLGHILANYSLIFDEYSENNETTGTWKNSLKKSLKATQIAYPGGDIFAHLDRKSFKSWQRNAIIIFLESQNIPVYRGKQILLLHKHKSSTNSASKQ
jgi:D-aminoacyl-tRNA deacylase